MAGCTGSDLDDQPLDTLVPSVLQALFLLASGHRPRDFKFVQAFGSRQANRTFNLSD